ncbi:MAG: repeat, subgroup, partial [Proteobacteria bacterium]|nr:repeat, subgroup [Pseudomonadota bacterium]
LWRWRHGGQPQPLAVPLSGKITALAADASGDRVAWGSSSGEVAVMRVADPARLLWQRAAATPTAVGALAFSDDGRHLAVARQGEVQLIDVERGRDAAIELRLDRPVTALRLSHDGRVLATTAADRSVRLWTVADGQPLGLRSSHRQAPSVAFSPDDRLLLVAERDRVSLWDIASGLPRGEVKTAQGEGARLLIADFSGPEAVVVVTENRVHRLRLVKGKAGEWRLPASVDDGVALALGDLRAWAASRSPDARTLALGGLDGRVRLIDLATLAFVGDPMRHDDAVLGIAWSADSSRVISWSRDRTVRVWGIDSGHLVADVLALENEARFVQPAQGALAVADEHGALWPLGSVPAGKVPDWLPTLLEETGGVRLDKGALQRLDQRADVLATIKPGTDAWSLWAATVIEKLRGPAIAGQGESK